MKCIVVEDEPFALDLAKSYIEKTPMLSLLGTFTNPFKALTYLMENEVDLIFLDINMPELSGIQLLKSLPKTPMVIFTTAYPEYGAESYEYNAVDYLLKPIPYTRFLKAVNKALEVHNTKKAETKPAVPKADTDKKEDFLMLKSGTKLHKTAVDAILFVEGAGNYMAFHLKDGQKILSLLTMKELLELLPESQFVRVHKSYVVALQHIQTIERHQVVINGTKIPIGLTYREHFMNTYGSSN